MYEPTLTKRTRSRIDDEHNHLLIRFGAGVPFVDDEDRLNGLEISGVPLRPGFGARTPIADTRETRGCDSRFPLHREQRPPGPSRSRASRDHTGRLVPFPPPELLFPFERDSIPCRLFNARSVNTVREGRRAQDPCENDPRTPVPLKKPREPLM